MEIKYKALQSGHNASREARLDRAGERSVLQQDQPRASMGCRSPKPGRATMDCCSQSQSARLASATRSSPARGLPAPARGQFARTADPAIGTLVLLGRLHLTWITDFDLP